MNREEKPAKKPKKKPAQPRSVEPAMSYSVAEACRHLGGIDRGTFDLRVADGSIQVTRFGGRVLVPRSEIERVLTLTAARCPCGIPETGHAGKPCLPGGE